MFNRKRRQSSANSNGATGSSGLSNTDQGGIDLAGSDYSERARRLIELATDLKALGANHILDIPRVVFIGNQSAGKSSVVEGVTGTKVPRDGGTCTRCPMECTVSKRGDSWSCTIQLHLEYESDRKPKVTPELLPFATTKKPAEVELWLRRAQAAILSRAPLDDAQLESFRKATDSELKKMQKDGTLLPFSHNTVELKILDPAGTDLSFVDLPGIIHDHESDPTMPALVLDLVQQNIKGLNTLIVITLPMTDDIQTQKAVEIARRADPTGLRTIGVATKPDTLQPGDLGSISAWKDILQGKAHTLRHGYFAVKLPNDATRSAGHTRTELQRQEAAFFDTTDPWKSFTDRSRFGIPNFVRNTSRLLVNLIERNLPILKKEVDALLTAALAEQKELPPLIDPHLSPLQTILSRVTRFCKLFEQIVEGKAETSFSRANQLRYTAFKGEVNGSAPAFWISWGEQPRNFVGLTMSDVRKEIEEHTAWEFSGYVPFPATKTLVLRYIRKWEEPALACFEAVSSSLIGLLERLLAEPAHFGRLVGLKGWIRGVIMKEELACAEETSVMIKRIFSLENSVPLYTQNTEAFTSAQSAWETKHLAYGRKASEHDEYRVMADVHAYLQVASQRFVDQVPLAIESMLHQELASRLEAKLMGAVLSTDSTALKEMLKEDPEIAEKRERIRQRVERLEAIKERLLEYERTSTYDSSHGRAVEES